MLRPLAPAITAVETVSRHRVAHLKCFPTRDRTLFWGTVFEWPNHDEISAAHVEGARAGRLTMAISYLSTAVCRPDVRPRTTKIAECLSSVDELMAASAEVDAQDPQKGLMQQLFPREVKLRPASGFPNFEMLGSGIRQWEWESNHREHGSKRMPVSARAGNHGTFTLHRIMPRGYRSSWPATCGGLSIIDELTTLAPKAETRPSDSRKKATSLCALAPRWIGGSGKSTFATDATNQVRLPCVPSSKIG